MGFKLEQRTQEWFDLAIERDLHHTITRRMPERSYARWQEKKIRRRF